MIQAEVTVAAVVRRANRYLVVEERVQGERVINQPAGHVEAGESLVEAVIRETREETAWGFRPSGLIGAYYWPHEDGRITLRFAFCGEVEDHAADQALDEGIVTTHWLTAEALAGRSDLRSPLVMQAIEDYERRAPMALDRIAHIDSGSSRPVPEHS